ncbi:hypothetical protein [Virgibacillus sp. YIM 98842]|uniref:hypothetical protein n=1 Tax=Virgibacillus sp. YIM 98842 TaxID=2663533 RepID=UPI0013DBF702|nr:hypothetical protein [Virgibacillus sp. YIM 98842]
MIFSSFIHSSAGSANEGDNLFIIRSLIGGIRKRKWRFPHHSFTHKLDQATKAGISSSFVHSSAESGNEREDLFIIHSLIS